MLRSGNAVAGAVERVLRSEVGGIKLIEQLNGGECVCAREIEEMGRAADGGGFLGGDAAKSEIVQLERQQRRIAGADQGFADDLLDGARKRGHSDGIPHLQQNRFGPVGEPVELRIGIFNGDERVVAFDDRAFLNRADAQRQLPPCLA